MQRVTLQQAFQLAVEHHRAGRLAEAEALYRQILASEPRHAEARHHLGVVALQAGRHDLAATQIAEAIALDPTNSIAFSHWGTALAALGQLDQAAAAYRRALQLKPDYAEAHYNLANILGKQGLLPEAMASYERALQSQPHYPDARYNLGNALKKSGRIEEAIAAYRQALQDRPDFLKANWALGDTLREQGRFAEAAAAYQRFLQLQPDHAGVYNRLGGALAGQGRIEEAIAAYHRALQLDPVSSDVCHNLGAALAELERFDEAVAAFQQAIKLQPDYPQACLNLSNAHKDRGQLEEAIAACRHALQLRPDYADAWSNLGVALVERRQFEEAATAYRRALELEPQHKTAQFNYSLLLLLGGQFTKAWPWYEARCEALGVPARHFPQPLWEGNPLNGQRILIHAEQGFGDSIQFIRYAQHIAALGGVIIAECPPALTALFREAKGVHEVAAAGDPLPPFDRHAPLLSLPRIFQTTPGTIPRETPYLFAEAARRAPWRARLSGDRSRLRLGLAWAGNPKIIMLRKRHISLAQLLPLLGVRGVDFFSLQVNRGAEQIRPFAGAAPITDYTEHLHDFADTAAFMAELDLIISVDTAVAHLAGALGRPVWTLLPFVPDWRWGLEGEQAPWYPTMRLFRQSAAGDWNTVLERVAEELQEETRRHLSSTGATTENRD